MKSSADWRPILVLPGVSLSSSVDGGRLAAVGPSDKRYGAVNSNLHLRDFLGRFKTAFGEALTPSLIIRPANAAKPKAEDVAAFRDVVALPRVIHARAAVWRATGSANSSDTLWSDYFDPYPAMVTPDGMIKVDAGAVDDLRFQEAARRFSGQVAPTVFDAREKHGRTDQVLQDALLAAWRRRPPKSNRAALRFRTRLFRSTAFAFHALRVSSMLAHRSEAATWLSLFVAAFETLVHPDAGEVGYWNVSDAIKSIAWRNKLLRTKTARVRYRKSGRMIYARSTRPVQIYQRLYRLRNEWLHGTETRNDRLERLRHQKWGRLEIQVPILYRFLVLSRLQEQGLFTPPSAGTDSESILRSMFEMDFEDPLLQKESRWKA